MLPNFLNSVRAFVDSSNQRLSCPQLDSGFPGRMIIPTSARGEIYLAAANLSILPVQTALVNQVLVSVLTCFPKNIFSANNYNF